MKATAKLLAVAVVAAGSLLATDVTAQEKGGARASGGARHWSGSHGGHWSGGHWRGGHAGWGYRHWYPSWSFYWGVPLAIGAAWGWPYYYDRWYYPHETVIYRDVVREPYPEGRMEPAPSTEAPRSEGAPGRGPLYMNYCESAKAYFPKVTSCPEGWKFLTPTS
jgi:hypothetical protein